MSNRKHVIAFVSVFILFLFIHTRAVFAATIFVDGTLSGTCSGSYSIANRTCTGTDGNAYNTLSGGVGAATAGDTVNIRGGTYNISSAVNVPFSSSTLTTTIQGYNSETVNIANSNVGAITFNLSSSATKNVLFKNLNLTGTQYYVITGWSNYSGNVWTATIPYSTTQVRFDTTTGTSVGSIAAVISANRYYITGTTIYAYSTGNPSSTYTSPGINLADNFAGIGIGNPSFTSAGNLITIDKVTFDNFSHAGVKGTWRWYVKNSKFTNIGTDTFDHDIYANGVQTSGNEMVFENNYFGYAPGAGIHFYIAPAYAIVRYNIFNGLSGANRGNYGILVGGSNIKVYNNTFYGYGSTGGVELYKNTSQNNEIKNNLFLNNTNDIAIDFGGSSYPTNNTVNSNYFGSSSKCLNCTDQTGAGGPNYSAFDDAPPNVYNTSPWTQFSYTFNKASTGTTTLQFFNGCGGGAFPTSGTWYLDDISIITQGGGVEKVTNGNMEGSFTSGVASGWTVAGGASGTQETGVVHSGSNSQKLNVAGGCGSRFEQSITLSAGNYVLTGWAKRDSSTATLTVYVAGGNSSFTIGDNGITFLGSAPYSTWNDFKINPLSTDLALVTDSALNLGSDHQYGLNSASTSIIPGTINQNQFGGGWDFGAFVYNNDTVAPSTSDNSDANTHTGPVSITLSCTDGSGSGCANTYYTTDGSTPTTLSPSGTNFTLSGDGTYTIKYFSVDNAGNTESVKTGSHQVIINSTAPSVAPTGVPIDISERPVDCPAGFVYCIDTGPNRKESLEFIRNDLSAPGVSVFISQDSTRDDIHMDITRSTMQNLLDETPAVPFPWSQGLNIASEIIRIKTLSAFNGYPIKTLIKPGTIILPYDETKHKNIPVSQLRIAWYNSDTRRWTVLQNNTVFDDANKTLSNTTTHLYGYFTVVYGSKTSSSVTNTGSDRTLGTTTKIKPSPTGKAHKMHTPLVPQTTSRNCILKFCW